jgi:4-amino-4-deoxy-L-arabinose transferase-like glycosyltransferase
LTLLVSDRRQSSHNSALSSRNGPRAAREWSSAILLGMLLALLAMVLGVEILGPSDLYDKDQPKTMGYTADIVLNGRWILPRDVANQPPTKPPLYNWLSVPIVGGLHIWKEWAFKFPSVVGGVLTVVLIVYALGQFVGERLASPVRTPQVSPLQAGLISGMLWLATAPTIRCVYLCRPDMLLTMFITASWVFATLALREQNGRKRFWLSLALWISVGCGWLTKGPPALLPMLYIPIAAKLLCGRWSAMTRTGIAWGIPLVIAMIAAWLVPAYRINPEHVKNELIGQQMVNRIASQAPEGMAPKPAYFILTWFNSEFAPWTVFTVLALLTAARMPRRASARFKPSRWAWVKSPAAPAGIFLVLGLIFFMCSAGKRSDYLLPLYPVAAVLAGYWMTLASSRLRLIPVSVGVLPLIIGGLLAYNRLSFGAKELPPHSSDSARLFARHVKATIGGDSVAFLIKGYHPILPLLGRHPGSIDALHSKWIIAQHKEAWHPVLVSQPIMNVESKHQPGKMALYRASDVPPAQLERMAKAVKTETAEE